MLIYFLYHYHPNLNIGLFTKKIAVMTYLTVYIKLVPSKHGIVTSMPEEEYLYVEASNDISSVITLAVPVLK